MSPALAAREADEAWFRANPDRRLRVRVLVHGELGEAVPGVLGRVMVLQRLAPEMVACWAVDVDVLPPDADHAGLCDQVVAR